MDNIKLFAKKRRKNGDLIQALGIYQQDIGMEFGIEKCAMFIMKSGKREIAEVIERLNQ